MQDQTLRTIGASVVLIGLVVAAALQIGDADSGQGAEIVVTEPTTTQIADTNDAQAQPSTTVAAPFVYRLGVLAGISTDNFWAYYGEQPSVWNSYILGPTKPALFATDTDTGSMTAELSAAAATPTWDGDGWRVNVPLSIDFAWSDGTPITADDFVFTFETVRSLALGGSWAASYPSIIESVHADSDHDLRIEFTSRPNLSVWPHQIGLAPVMAKHIWAEVVGDVTAKELFAMSGEGDVSGGPLDLAMVSDSMIVSNVNPGHPNATGPDTVEYHVYESEEALVAAVRDGDIDALLTPKGIAQEHLAAIEDDGSVTVLTSPANGIRYLGFNLARAPMSDLAFRTALGLLLDRRGLASRIPQSGEVAWSMVPSANRQWFDVEAAAGNEDLHDGDLSSRLERALAGLRDVGYSWTKEPAVNGEAMVSGEGLTVNGQTPQPLTILTPGDEYDPARPEYVEKIAETLNSLGFDTRPVETDFDTVVDLAFTPGEDGELHYDMYMLGWTLGSPTLPEFYRPLFAANGEMNNTGYESQKFEKALLAYERAFTSSEAIDALWTMEQTISTDLPYLPLYTSQLTEIYRSDRVAFGIEASLGGLQGRLGGIGDVRAIDE